MVGDYQVCIDEATAFLNVAKLCTDDISGFLLGKMYPFVVNVSFSCELFIKAIMIKQSPIWANSLTHLMIKIKQQSDRHIRKSAASHWMNCWMNPVKPLRIGDML